MALLNIFGKVFRRRGAPEEVDIPTVHHEEVGDHPRSDEVWVAFYGRHDGAPAQGRSWGYGLSLDVHHVHGYGGCQVLLSDVDGALVPQLADFGLRGSQNVEVYLRWRSTAVHGAFDDRFCEWSFAEDDGEGVSGRIQVFARCRPAVITPSSLRKAQGAPPSETFAKLLSVALLV